MHSTAQIRALYIYPIKGLPGIQVHEWPVVDSGFQFDRSWMLVDHSGEMITQRTRPDLTQFKVRIVEDGFKVAHGQDSVLVPKQAFMDASLQVRIWKHELLAQRVSPELDDFFSNHLSQDLYLVRQKKSGDRKKKLATRKVEIPLEFTDGYPIHIISLESLSDLSRRTGFDVSATRFRPNIIVDGMKAYDEESFSIARTDQVEMDLIKATVRCSVPNIDPTTGKSGVEPIRTLSTYKKKGNQIEFGVYGAVQQTGTLKINQPISFQ